MVGALVTEDDPGYPPWTKVTLRSCVHEYGKGVISALKLKWRYRAGAPVTSSCSADINGDGLIEVIFGSGGNRVFCVRGDTGELLWYQVVGTGADHTAIFDMNDDDLMEVIALGGTAVKCFYPNGDLMWAYYPGYFVSGHIPLIIDTDGDCLPNVVFGVADGRVILLSSIGRLIKTYFAPAETEAYGIAGIPQVGRLFIAHGSGYAICLDGKTFTEKWRFKVGPLSSSYCQAMSLSSTRYAGILRVLCDCWIHHLKDLKSIGRFWCLSSGGSPVWYYDAERDTRSITFAAYDVDGDGMVECFKGARDFYIYCLSAGSGTFKWRFLTGNYVDTSACLADVDNDGKMEVIFGSSDYRIYVLEHNGSLKTYYRTDGEVTKLGSASIDDIDGDGNLEICAGSGDTYLYVLEDETEG